MPYSPPLVIVHRISAFAGMTLIASFWASTVLVELFGAPDAIARVKTIIALLLPALILALATAGLTGRRLAKGWKSPIAAAKRKRTAIAAANAILILIPAAIFLAIRARAGQFDTSFYAVQAAELVAGAANLMLLIANARAGHRLKRPSAA
jgi:hypothetical protein